jgi:glutaredoxin 3
MQINSNNNLTVELWSQLNCPACEEAKNLLVSRGIAYQVKMLNVDITKEEFYARLPDARSVPQIFINNEHIGGLAELTNVLR